MEKRNVEVGSTGNTDVVAVDRISDLPDEILLQILSFLPIKLATRTGVLSRRWRHLCDNLWAHSDNLDFGGEFAKNQSLQQYVRTVNRYLKLYKRDTIESFRISYNLGRQNQRLVGKWIKFATVMRSVKNLDLDFQEYLPRLMSLPSCLYTCNSLTHLKLGRCKLRLPLKFPGFKSLVSLYLLEVPVSNIALQSVLANCPVLSSLSLCRCRTEKDIKISCPKDLKLKTLLVFNTKRTKKIEISAPTLKSYHFCGSPIRNNVFKRLSGLEDVYLDSSGFNSRPTKDYAFMLSRRHLNNIKILTLCAEALKDITVSAVDDYFPIVLPNVRELQIIMRELLEKDNLVHMYYFFNKTVFPCLEKLFIELSGYHVMSKPVYQGGEIGVPPCWFDKLKTIKITNFHVLPAERRMMSFFLSRARSLERLILVAAQYTYLQKCLINVKNSTGNFPVFKHRLENHRILMFGPEDVVEEDVFPTHAKYLWWCV